MATTNVEKYVSGTGERNIVFVTVYNRSQQRLIMS